MPALFSPRLGKQSVPVVLHGTVKCAESDGQFMPGSFDTPIWCRGENAAWFHRTLRYLGHAAACFIVDPYSVRRLVSWDESLQK